MMKMNQLLVMAGLAGVICFGAGNALGQRGQGNFNFDPAEIQKRMMDNYKEQLEVTDEAEWKIIGQRIQKVLDARREASVGGGLGGMARMFGGGRGGGPRGGALAAFAPTPDPDEEALQKAIDAKATNSELKAALAKVMEARKKKQANLEKAQVELRQVLSVRQEAISATVGLL